MKRVSLPRAVTGIGALFFMLALVFVTERFFFLNHAYSVEAKVLQGEVYRGPPRLPGSVPLKIQYVSEDGESRITETRAPFLRQLEAGQSVQVLVNAKNPLDARLPTLPEMWGWPVGLAFGSIVLIVLAAAVRSVPRQR